MGGWGESVLNTEGGVGVSTRLPKTRARSLNTSRRPDLRMLQQIHKILYTGGSNKCIYVSIILS